MKAGNGHQYLNHKLSFTKGGILNKFLLIFLSYWVLGLNVSANELSKGMIGPLRTGVHIFDLAKYDTTASVKRKQFEEDFYLEYSFNLKDIGIINVLLKDDDRTVYKLSTKSSSITTAEGARVGMTLDELKVIYPNGRLTISWDSIDALHGFVLPEHNGVFVFNGSKMVESCEKNVSDCETFLGSISSIEYFTYSE